MLVFQIKKILNDFLIWRENNLELRYLVIILSALIGICCGIGALLLKTTIFYIEQFISGELDIEFESFLFVILPLIGIIIVFLLFRFVIRDEVSHSIPRILYVISKKGGNMKRHKVFSSILGGALTAGFGGSVGLESPMISSGSTLSSNLGRILNLNYKTKVLLIGCGATGAIASIFTTPIAAVIFALEVLMLDLTISSIIPLLVASVSGAITTKVLMSEQILINYEINSPYEVYHIPFFILLGIVTGFISMYFNSINSIVREKIQSIKNNYHRILIGGIIIGLLIFLFPPLYGEGYASIKSLLKGDVDKLFENSLFFSIKENYIVFVGFFIALILLKVVAMTITLSIGGVGGIFAPIAVTGGIVGFLFSRLMNDFVLTDKIPENHFTLVGMAGGLAGVLHAPLTAIFLIAEITNGYDLIIPLMITTVISYVTVKIYQPHSIITKRLAERGELLTHDKDKAILTLLNIKTLIETDMMVVKQDLMLGTLIKDITKSDRDIIVVVDDEKNFKGIVLMNHIRKDLFVKKLHETPIELYIVQPAEIIYSNDSMTKVMDKFNATGEYNLPVIKNGKYYGFINRAKIFSEYRKTLIDVSPD